MLTGLTQDRQERAGIVEIVVALWNLRAAAGEELAGVDFEGRTLNAFVADVSLGDIAIGSGPGVGEIHSFVHLSESGIEAETEVRAVGLDAEGSQVERPAVVGVEVL